MQEKIRKMITEKKNKSWEKTRSTVESYLGGKQSTEAWRILKNFWKNEKEDNILTSYLLANGKHSLKDV